MQGISKIALLMAATATLAPPSEIAFPMTRVAYAGNNAVGSGLNTSNGTPINITLTQVNLSGAAVNKVKVVFGNWYLASNTTVACPNDVPIAGTIEYPSGTTIGTWDAITSPSGGVASAIVNLSAPIPNNATFIIKPSSNLANGLKYIQNLGFAACSAIAMSNTVKKAAIAVFGDSIITLNYGAFYIMSQGKIPCFQCSYSGTTAQGYAFGTNFDRQLATIKEAGFTHIVCNWATNDIAASRSAAQIIADLTTLRNKAQALGLKWYHATILPRTNRRQITITNLTQSGGVATATVAAGDIGYIIANRAYVISGVSDALYNRNIIIDSINTGNNTFTFAVSPTANAAPTGTITITPWKWSNEMQIPMSGFEAGEASARALVNAWTRSGNFDGVVEWGDACEPARNVGRWLIGGENSRLNAIKQGKAVTAVTSQTSITTNANTPAGDLPSYVASTGFILWRTGANAKLLSAVADNSGGVLTLSSAPPNTIVVGDTFDIVPKTASPTDDGTHPAAPTGSGQPTDYGGQILINKVASNTIDALLA